MKRKALLVIAAAAAVAAIVVLTTGAFAGTAGRSDQSDDGFAAFISCLASHGVQVPSDDPAAVKRWLGDRLASDPAVQAALDACAGADKSGADKSGAGKTGGGQQRRRARPDGGRARCLSRAAWCGRSERRQGDAGRTQAVVGRSHGSAKRQRGGRRMRGRSRAERPEEVGKAGGASPRRRPPVPAAHAGPGVVACSAREAGAASLRHRRRVCVGLPACLWSRVSPRVAAGDDVVATGHLTREEPLEGGAHGDPPWLRWRLSEASLASRRVNRAR
jgi:hypothetical protein